MFATRTSRSPQPIYQGRPLGRWLVDLNEGRWPARMQAEQVLREAGTNALPFLVDEIQARDSLPKFLLVEILGTKLSAKLGITSAWLHRARAVEGLRALGDAAKPAIPHLVCILEDVRFTDPAASALVAVGRDGVCSLTNGLVSTNYFVRETAVAGFHGYVYGHRRQNTDELEMVGMAVAPVLMGSLLSADWDNQEAPDLPMTGQSGWGRWSVPGGSHGWVFLLILSSTSLITSAGGSGVTSTLSGT